MDQTPLVSCNPELLYSGGGYYDPSYPLERLLTIPKTVSSSIDTLTILFERTIACRSVPQIISNDVEVARIKDFFVHIEKHYPVCAPSILVQIDEALIWNNMVFVVVGNEIFPLYESYRVPDRDQQGDNLVERIPPHQEWQVLPDETSNIFIGSSGSFNFGHWLADDFAKASAIPYIKQQKDKKCRVVMSHFNHLIDPVRGQGASLFLDQRANEDVIFLHRDICYRASNLYYPSPISFHPVLKNTHALNYTRQFLLEAASDRFAHETEQRLLFVNRASNWPRQILNIDDVRAVMTGLGARETDCDNLGLLDQVAMFHHAECVIGIMGAAMTNQLFCKANTDCIYLAPSEWQEPFYWDLADQIGQKYKVCYGDAETNSGNSPYQRSFSVDMDQALKLKSGTT